MKSTDKEILNQLHLGNHLSKEEVKRAYIVLEYLKLTLDNRFKK